MPQALLATLEGNIPRRNRDRRRVEVAGNSSEFMGGPFDDLYSLGKAVVRGGAGVVTGTTHMVMEAGRGVATGDPLRVLASPFKGATHAVMETGRGVVQTSEHFWRPSKMEWMQPAGAALTAAAPFTGPGAAILLPLGAGLTAVGTVSNTLYAKDLSQKATTQAEIAAAEQKQKTTNQLMLVGLGLAAAAALAYTMT